MFAFDVDFVLDCNFFLFRPSVGYQTVTCCLVGFLIWLSGMLIMRYTLKMLLMYKGFMFESRGKKVSLKTKIWAVLVKCKLAMTEDDLYDHLHNLF